MTPMRGRDVALATLVALVWAFNFVVIRIGLGDFPPLLFAGLRFVFTAFPAILLVGRGGISWRLILTTGACIGVGYFSLLFVAMRLGLPPGLSALVSQAQVLFTALLSAVVLNQPPNGRQTAGMLLALAGLALAGSDHAADAPLPAFLLVVLAALCWAFGNTAIKRSGPVDGFRLVLWMSVVPPLPNFALSALLEHGQWEAMADVGWSGVLAVAYTALASTLFGWGAWAWLLRRYHAPQVAPFSLLVPVLSMAMSAVMTGEALTGTRMAAAALLLGGLALTLFGDVFGRMLSWRPSPPLMRKVPARKTV